MDMSRGSRGPRLEDVAERVGMSPASVSMVLSGAPGPSAATRERVLAAAQELGYRPDARARSLAGRASNLIASCSAWGWVLSTSTCWRDSRSRPVSWTRPAEQGSPPEQRS